MSRRCCWFIWNLLEDSHAEGGILRLGDDFALISTLMDNSPVKEKQVRQRETNLVANEWMNCSFWKLNYTRSKMNAIQTMNEKFLWWFLLYLKIGVLYYSVIDFLTKNGIDYVSLLVIAAVQFHKVFMVINWLHLNPVCFCVIVVYI